MSSLSREEAASVLGVAADVDPVELRRAYRAALRQFHPDLNGARDATDATVRLTLAYRTMSRPVGPPTGPPTNPSTNPSGSRQREPGTDSPPEPRPANNARMVDVDTIAVTAPREEALMATVAAGHRLGEVTYLDRACGLVEVLVEFADAPTSSLVVTLQGRATGDTELLCSVEPLSGGRTPEVEAVTRLLLRTMHGEDPSA